MNRIIILTILFVIMANAGTRDYDMEPYKNVNAWSPRYGYIGETFTAICDSFVWLDFFVGIPNDSTEGKHYNVVIQDGENGPLIASGVANAGVDYDYTKASLVQEQGIRITKGK